MSKEHTQCVGAAMRRYNAACAGHVHFLKGIFGLHGFHHGIHNIAAAARVGDKHAAIIYIFLIGKPFLHIAHKHVCEPAAIFFAHAHSAVLHFDAGLKLKKIGTQSCHSRATAALVEIFQLIHNKGCIHLFFIFIHSSHDLFGALALA